MSDSYQAIRYLLKPYYFTIKYPVGRKIVKLILPRNNEDRQKNGSTQVVKKREA